MRPTPAAGLDRDPLFVALTSQWKGRPLQPDGIGYIVENRGRMVGVDVRAHGLRHTSITTALDETNGDIPRVQAHSRHRSIAIVAAYDDRRGAEDTAREIAGKLDAVFTGNVTRDREDA